MKSWDENNNLSHVESKLMHVNIMTLLFGFLFAIIFDPSKCQTFGPFYGKP
jgi:hypothetical protein